MPTIIEQIAADLNVSSASVSRALNDRPGVGSALRERILERASELNYTPSLTARGLATSQTFAVGFFIREKPGLPTLTDPFYGEILHGVEQAVSTTDYHVSVATLTDAILDAPHDFRFVREKRVDGMILAGPDIPTDFIIAMLQTGLPVVLVDNRLDYSPVNCVNNDDETGAFLAAHHLVECGHTHIGVIAGPEEWASNARRVSGYYRALRSAGLALNIVHVDRTTIESGAQAYHLLMNTYPQITGLCAINDSMAIGAIRAAQTDGKSIPADLSIVGFDDIEWSALVNPPLTTISIAKRQIGKEAANRMITLLNDPEAQPTEVIVSVQLIQRESTTRVQ
jgi:LacI family transcriptional regulator